MPHRVVLAALVCLLPAGACGGRPPGASSGPAPWSASPTVGTASSRASPSSIAADDTPATTAPVAVPGVVQLPTDAPRTFEPDVDASDVPLRTLAPPGAVIGTTWSGSVATRSLHATTQAIVFSWSRGDPMAPESGLEAWFRWDTTADPLWRVVFAFTDHPRAGVLGVRFETGDVTHDRSSDVLSFESLGGSGACGVWRVVSLNVESIAEIYRAQTCDTDARIVGGDLATREAVFAADDAHCCPSAYRTTTLRWTGRRWKVVSRSTEPV